jgi:hypothetical protein
MALSNLNLNKHKFVQKVAKEDIYCMGVRQGRTDGIAACPVSMQSFDLRHGNGTVASSGGGGAQLHTTTTKSYNTETLECLVCTGSREKHYILENFETNKISILLGDQHLPALITM